MKKPFYLIASVLLLGLFASCDSQNGTNVDYIPFQSSSDGNWGLISPDGDILLDGEFKNKPTAVVNDRFFVEDKDGMYEIWTAEEKTKTVGEKYLGICPFTEDVTVAVQKNQHICIIDKKGKTVATLDKANGKNIKTARAFSEGLSLIETEDGLGFVDTKGKVVIENKYVFSGQCSDGKIIVLSQKEYEKKGQDATLSVIDKKGNELFTIKSTKYQILSAEYKHGYLPVKLTGGDESKCGFLDDKGEEILKPTSKIQSIVDWTADDFIFSDGSGYGLKSMDGETIIRAKYDAMQYASEDLIWAYKSEDKGYILIDKEGNEVTDEPYKDITKFMGNNALVKLSAKDWGIIDNSGNEIKLKVDIYNINLNVGAQSVTSDFMDLDAIVTALNITSDGFGGMGINMTPQQLIKAYGDASGNSVEPIRPDRYAGKDKLEYYKSVEGVNIAFETYYRIGYLARSAGSWYDSSYEWTSEKPSYVKAEITGSRLDGKVSNLFRQILDAAKPLGNVYKENRGAAIIAVRGGCILVINHGSYVSIARENGENYKNYDISEYQNVEDGTEINATIEEACDTLAEEIVDTVAYDEYYDY